MIDFCGKSCKCFPQKYTLGIGTVNKGEAEDYGAAFKKGSKLTAEFNKALAELKKDGEYDKIYAKWFGNQK